MDEKLLLAAAGTTDPLLLRLRGGGVRRYHTEGALFQQSVAEHTWCALQILLHFWPDTSLQTVKAMLDHDVPEGIYGDMPAPTKREPGIKAVFNENESELDKYLGVVYPESDIDAVRMKIADYAELCSFVRAIPGQRARRIWDNGLQYLLEALKKLPPEELQRVYPSIFQFITEEC